MAIIDKYEKYQQSYIFAKKDIVMTSFLNSARTFYNTVRNINI